MQFVYGFDPLCGWCYGAVPAIRRLRADHPDLPVRLVMAGLVTGPRVGPYAEIEGYIRGASARLREVTGRAPSEAFFETIRRPGVTGDSAPPCVAIDAVRRAAPERALDYAHRVIEAHFEEGADLGRPEVLERLARDVGADVALPDLRDSALARAAWAEGRTLGLKSFPSFGLIGGRTLRWLPTVYEPGALSALVAEVRAAG